MAVLVRIKRKKGGSTIERHKRADLDCSHLVARGREVRSYLLVHLVHMFALVLGSFRG